MSVYRTTGPLVFRKKVKTVNFSETIAARDLKVGRSRHLIEYMKVCSIEDSSPS